MKNWCTVADRIQIGRPKSDIGAPLLLELTQATLIAAASRKPPSLPAAESTAAAAAAAAAISAAISGMRIADHFLSPRLLLIKSTVTLTLLSSASPVTF